MAKEFIFKLSATASEYSGDRFGGQEVTLTLPETREELRAMIADGQDEDAVIMGLINGQGLRLTKQKKVKDVLGAGLSESGEYTKADGTKVKIHDLPIEEALALAQSEAEGLKIGAPRRKGEGGRRSKRVAEAEAKAETATNAARDMYLSVPASVRKNLRPQLVEKFGEETIAAWESAS